MSKKNFRTSEPGQVAMPTAVRETAPDGPAAGALPDARGTPHDQDEHHVETLDDRVSGTTPASPAPAPELAYIAEALRPLAVPISQLREMEANARLHGWRDLTALAESLKRFGQLKPVVATRDGAVVAGNGTLVAARRMGWRFLAVSWCDLSPELARQFAIADNRLAEMSQWDLQQLADDAASVDLSPWWTPTELADLLSALGTDAPADFAPAPDAPQGQLDALGSETTCPACGHRFEGGGR